MALTAAYLLMREPVSGAPPPAPAPFISRLRKGAIGGAPAHGRAGLGCLANPPFAYPYLEEAAAV